MRLLVCLLAAVLPAACLARQKSFCEDKIYPGEPLFGRPAYHDVEEKIPRERLFGRPAYHDLEEKIPGWVFIEGNRLQARIHGNTFWNIKGTIEEKFPVDDFLFDPLTFTLNHPTDFEGPFTGRIGRGEIVLKWKESGATIVGRSPFGDFEIKGNSYIDWSP